MGFKLFGEYALLFTGRDLAESRPASSPMNANFTGDISLTSISELEARIEALEAYSDSIAAAVSAADLATRKKILDELLKNVEALEDIGNDKAAKELKRMHDQLASA